MRFTAYSYKIWANIDSNDDFLLNFLHVNYQIYLGHRFIWFCGSVSPILYFKNKSLFQISQLQKLPALATIRLKISSISRTIISHYLWKQ